MLPILSSVSTHHRIAVKDLTEGSIVSHLLTMAAPLAVSMLTQIAYQLIDLYFVTRIGVAATAGVNTAGNVVFIVSAIVQVLGVGTMALVAQAVGRKDQVDANLVFNQSMLLSAVCGVMTSALLYVFTYPYLQSIAADAATIDAGAMFILWMLPGYAVTLPMTVLSSALRGTGIVRPTIVLYMLTVTINAILAPILIAGWGTGAPLGVMGAGLATSISIVVGTIILGVYFHRSQRYLTLNWQLMRPLLQQWRRVLVVGLPVGGELVIAFLFAAVVYYAIRDFGVSAQAGYGIGFRVLQTIMLPGLAVGFAAGPIAGQNFGAKKTERVRETFRKAALMGVVVMITTILLVQWQPQALVGIFDADASTIAVAIAFLQLASWALAAQGLAYTCSSMFQGLGNTVPSLISFGTCFIAFAIPVLWLSTQPTFHIEQVWYVWIGALTLQATVSLCLLRVEFRRRLRPIAASGVVRVTTA
jgi:putative MATE family efflux protein